LEVITDLRYQVVNLHFLDWSQANFFSYINWQYASKLKTVSTACPNFGFDLSDQGRPFGSPIVIS